MTNPSAAEPKTASVRRLKIETVGDFWRGLIKPKIRLTGNWLEQAGFPPGSHVQVICMAPGVIELRSAGLVNPPTSSASLTRRSHGPPRFSILPGVTVRPALHSAEQHCSKTMNTLTANPTDNITLYFREGRSDKIYQCAIEPAGDGRFAVTFAYGRRGTTLSTGTKTNSPVGYDDAKRIFDKLVREKMAKGYTLGADGTPYVGGSSDKQSSGYLPQLLNPIDEAEVQRLLRDNIHVAQEKFDGRRLLLRKQGAAIDGINRKGLVVGLPEPVFQAVYRFPGDCVLDGESIGDVFHVFDLLELDGQDIRAWAYRERLVGLMNLLGSVQQRTIRYVETAFTTEQKQRRLEQLKSANKEGIVFKRLDAPYTPGRPNSGGPQLKHKFYATLSAVVSKINAQRSVEIRLFGKDGWHPAGNVTIPPNHRIPVIGHVVEVRYLYATDAGILYQPTYLGERTDVEQHECVRSQLKFKPAGEEAEAA